MAVTHFATDLDLHLNQLRQARFETISQFPAPTAANAGLLVRYAADGQLYASTGTSWTALSGARGFVHTQLVPQAVITVTHGLGYRPAVSMYSPDFGVQYAEFQTEHLDTDTVRVSMDTPQACVLVMS
jgi:hypothetical protein